MGLCPLCSSANSSSCTRPYCPQRIKRAAFDRMRPLAKMKNYSGPAPTPFVGEFNYPNVNVGILGTPAPPRDPEELDAPRTWSARGFGINEVVGIRSSLINARFVSNVRNPSRLISVAQEVSMATRPADVDIKLERAPGISLYTDRHAAPNGPSGPAAAITLTSNPSIHTAVENAVSDTDWKAADAAWGLYQKGFDEHTITKLLSVGNLGVGSNRRLVPTKWSITASDDLIAKRIALEIRDLPQAGPMAFFGGYLGNHYLILCLPGPWSFELFETMVRPNKDRPADDIESYTDYESPFGRKEYASETVGGYYACRLAVLERLKEMKRKASVLALRFVTEEYSLPLGVWVVREATRNAMASPPLHFSADSLAITFAQARSKKTFGLDISGLIRRSRLLDQRKRQPRLERYL